MISYGRLASRIWAAASGNGDQPIDTRMCYELDHDIEKWLQSIPNLLPLVTTKGTHRGTQSVEIMELVQPLLYLRGNQMRILIYRRCLFSRASVASNLTSAQLAVDVARDTIKVLNDLKGREDFFRKYQTTLNQFAVSALAVLFLAICHAPKDFIEACQSGFYIAIDLIRGSAARSFAAIRLEKTIARLKHIASRLGLASKASTTAGQHHRLQPNNVPGQANARSPQMSHTTNNPAIPLQNLLSYNSGFQMSHDFMSLFDDDTNETGFYSFSNDPTFTLAQNEFDLFPIDEGAQVSEMIMNLF